MLISVVMQGMLRDGITTWMPTYIAETFNLGNNVSILTTAILPLFSVFGTGLTTFISKKIGNELKSSAVFFGAAFLSNTLMALLFAKFIPLDIACMAVVNICMHGVNLMLISNVPRHFAKYGKVSMISGIMNAATYIGSALSTYVFALLSDKFGWSFTVVFWAVIALVGAALCALCIGKWKKFCKKSEAL
jgi:OPA family glycerol-3-phosphate transporter-like MFS transporter